MVFLSQAYLVFMTSIRVYLATCILLWWRYSKNGIFPFRAPLLPSYSKFHNKGELFCLTFQLVFVFWHFDKKALCNACQYKAFKDILTRYVPLGILYYSNSIKVIRIQPHNMYVHYSLNSPILEPIYWLFVLREKWNQAETRPLLCYVSWPLFSI